MLATLGPRAASPDPGRDGVFRIDVPWPFRGPDVLPVYPAATFRRSVAVRHRPDAVDYLTPLHPLVKAVSADVRRRLLHVFPATHRLPARRLAATSAPPGESASVVFTFLGSITGGGGMLEERMLAVRLAPNGSVIGTPEENLALVLSEYRRAEFEVDDVVRVFAERFDRLRDRATATAQEWLERASAELGQRRKEQAGLLRQDLAVDVDDRLREIDEDERLARHPVGAEGQQRLFPTQTTRGGHRARRDAVGLAAEQRQTELAAFETVERPGAPRPLGALLLLPSETSS